MVLHKALNVTARPRTEDIQISEDIDFKSMFLPEPILEGLKKSGYIKPSPIQKKALPLVRCGFDLIVQAKAGTGKTCVFTVAVLELVKPSLSHLQAIVLAPTREIALQITTVIQAIGQCVQGLKVGCFIGGYPLSVDVEKVKGCQVAVAAPGRLKHLLEKGLLNPRHVRLLVLDEADKLMEAVFLKDINTIFGKLPDSKQVLACSATYTDELKKFLARFMNVGHFVSPQTVSSVLLGVRQFVSIVPRHVDTLAQLKIKEKQLLYLLRSISFNQCLIFSNLHTRAQSLCNLLKSQGWGVDWIAGRLEQKNRVAALSHLRDQRVRVLVTTDLTARGIDVENVNLVINFDLTDHHTYLHRMGRAGRYGSHGIVITVVSDGKELTAFKKIMGKISGADSPINCVPQNLKNIDLWTTSDDEFEKVFPRSVKEHSDAIQISESSSTDSSEKCSPESSDSEGYVKEYKGENSGEEVNGGVDSVRNVMSGEFTAVVNRDINGDMSVSVLSVKGTSTDEKLSRSSSDSEESKPSAHSCVCDLYEADASDVRVIAGPSLFALEKKEHWCEVLPVVINESKIPLNTPIALLDSKLIRVRFWDKAQICGNYNIEMSQNKVINFDTNCEEKEYLSFQDVVSTLENGVEAPATNACENNGKKILSFENIEDALESGFCEIDRRILVKSTDIEQVLMKYNLIKERSESAFINFDSFDLVGWLAVDGLHNIIEEINIDKCEVFEFNLVSCLAGKKHIEVLSRTKGKSNEAHDYIDHITTLNVERLALTRPFSLSNIARHIAPTTSISAEHLFNGDSNPKVKLDKSNTKKVMQKDRMRHEIDISCVNESGKCSKVKTDISLKKHLKVPIVDSNKMNGSKKNTESDSVNGRRKRYSSITKSGLPSTSKRNNHTKNSHISFTNSSNVKKKNEHKYLLENNESGHREQINRYTKGERNSSKQQQEHEESSDESDDSSTYVDMTWNGGRNGHGADNLGSLSGNQSRPNSGSPRAKSDLLYQNKSKKETGNRKYGFESIRKHRNSVTDSYDSFDTVEYETTEYETTDRDKGSCYKIFSENGMQREHHRTKYQDSNKHSFKESYNSQKCYKPKVVYSQNDERKPLNSTNIVLETQDLSIESEGVKPHPKIPPKVQLRKEQKNICKSLDSKNVIKAASQQNDSQGSYQEKYDSYKSIESEISKLRKLNLRLLKEDELDRKHVNQHKQVCNGSGDEDSFESGGTNRHSFKTACSQHVNEDRDYLLEYGTFDRSSCLGSHVYENSLEIPLHVPRTQRKCSDRERYNYHSLKKEEAQDSKHGKETESSHNVHDNHTYGSYGQNQFASFQNGSHQNHEFSDLPGRSSATRLRGEHLHREWYSNWYLQVRQRASQLAMMEYVNVMSTQ